METTAPGAALVPLALRGVRTHAMVLLDPDGTIVGWNAGAERMLGYPAGAVLGRSFTILYLPEDLASDKPAHELREAAEAGCSSDDNWLLRRDGSRLFASGLTEPLRDAGRTLAGYVKIFRDVSDRRRVEEALHARADELADSDRRKERLLAALSHGLRDPIAPIRAAVESLERDLGGADGRTAQALETIGRRTRDLGRLVDDLVAGTRTATASRPDAPPGAAGAVAPEAIVALVVDDNVDGADSIAMLLGMRGHPVHVAYNGPQALELAVAVQPDVVLLDIGLPGMDGYGVAQRLRETLAKRCVLAAMTGYGTPADRARAFDAGFDHHLLKPVEPDRLEAMLIEVGRRLAQR